jgi:hypothetical protein
MATELCTVLNKEKMDHYLANCRPNFATIPNNTKPVWNGVTQQAIINYLAVINYNITEPIIKNLTDTFGEKAETFVKREIERNKLEKLESGRKIHTLKYWSAKKVPKKDETGKIVYKKDENGNDTQDPVLELSYNLIFDNSDEGNNARNGFTFAGEKYGKMFKKENEDYLITDPKKIHYDSLEDIQFNYKYWEEICQRTLTNICLFSGLTSAFKYNENDKGAVTPGTAAKDPYKFLKDRLELNYFLKPSANIFISCENLCLAAKLNSQFYKMDAASFYNLPCIGFDDLVITYNSNIIFCRSLIPSFYPGTKEELQTEFNLASLLTLNKNYTECKRKVVVGQGFIHYFDLGKYEFINDEELSALIKGPINEENVKAYINVGNDEEKNRRKAAVLNLLKDTFFNSEETRKRIIDILRSRKDLNANKFRIAYKDIFLVSRHCNECSKERLIGIVTENNNTRSSPLQEVHFVKNNKQRTFPSQAKVLTKKTCIWCGDDKCSKTENPENIRYELDINCKIFAELLIKNHPDITTEQRDNFYNSLNAELPGLIENPYRFIRGKFLIALGQEEITEVSIEDYDKYANTNPSLYSYDKIRSELTILRAMLNDRIRGDLLGMPSYSELPAGIQRSRTAGGTRKYRKQNKKQSKKKNPINSKKRYNKKSKKTRKSRK